MGGGGDYAKPNLYMAYIDYRRLLFLIIPIGPIPSDLLAAILKPLEVLTSRSPKSAGLGFRVEGFGFRV